jgi:16S rRNA processing protein RimM
LNKSAPKEEVVLIGKIVGVHGVKGTSKISPYIESLAILKPGTTLLMCTPDGSENSYEINWVKPHSRGALLALRDLTSRDQAKALVGSELYIKRAGLPKLEEDAYYWFDLIGLKVYTSDDEYLGRLDSIIETGANDVYVIKKDDREILIPALKSVVRSVDIGRKIMRVELPDGLDEI